MVLILKYLIQITRVSQAIQSGVLESILFPWALEQGAAVHDLAVLEEKLAAFHFAIL